MGSLNTDGSDKTVTVLITGFAPFKKDYPVNPSWEIARSLPDYLPPLRAKAPHPNPVSSPTTTTTTTTTISSSSSSTAPDPNPNPNQDPPVLPPVRILIHPSPIRVNYSTVRQLIPQLWDLDGTAHPDRPKIDAVIHIGMAGPRLFYSIERRGHRDGYCMPDVDLELPRDGTALVGNERTSLPEELESAFDAEDVLRRWRGYSPKHMDLRISEDAGHYLCDFIYYTSLAHLYQAGERRRVLFLHVPSDASEHSIDLGRELVLQLVRSVVESEMVRREKEEKDKEGASGQVS